MEECAGSDFSALQKELSVALETDRKHQRENAAKFRAIHQKVATYEEFRDIVKAAHLKPLDKKDKTTGWKQSWNPVRTGTWTGQMDHTITESLQSVLSESLPRNESEFSQDWRRFKGSVVEKYRFLLRLGGEMLSEMFHTEVSSVLLGEFLMVLCQCFSGRDEAAVTGVLQGLSLTGRFSLGVCLLSEEERRACESLFYKLLETNFHLTDAPKSQKEGPAACETQPEDDGRKAEIRGLMAKYGVCENAQ